LFIIFKHLNEKPGSFFMMPGFKKNVTIT